MATSSLFLLHALYCSCKYINYFFLVREAGFHILITSYQLLVSDEKYFRRVKWQYMVLDEAQAIKSSSRFLHLPQNCSVP